MSTEEEKKTPPNKASHDEVLDPQPKSLVSYGGKEYEIRPLSMKAVLKLTRVVAGAIAKARNVKLKEGDEASAVIALLENLDDSVIAELISAILGIDLKVAEDGFKVSNALEVINASMQLEDVKSIFFQIRQMAANIRPVSKSTQ